MTAGSEQELLDGFRALDTPTVSDALDKLGVPGACQGIGPIGDARTVAGRAFTVRFSPVGAVKSKTGDFIDDVAPGEIIVLDNGGRTHCTVWGDILTHVAVNKKIGATVIDGVCRDVAGIRELGYSLYSRGTFMATGKDRVTVRDVGVPVSVSDVGVVPGDVVVADVNGVVIVPDQKAHEVLGVAREIEAVESQIVAAVSEGTPLIEARQQFGYDALQRKEG